MMRHNIVVILIIFLIAILPSPIFGQVNAKMYIDQSKIIVSPGQEFAINLKVEPGTNEVLGLQYEINFDNTILTAVRQQKNSFFDGKSTIPVSNNIDNDKGLITYGETIIGTTGIKNSGTATSITFKVKDTTNNGVISKIVLQNVILVDLYANPINGTEIGNADVEISIPAADSTPIKYVPEIRSVIGLSLQKVLDNTSGTDTKIAVIVIAQPNYLNKTLTLISSYGETASNIKPIEFINAVALETTKSRILELSRLDYIDNIDMDQEGLSIADTSTPIPDDTPDVTVSQEVPKAGETENKTGEVVPTDSQKSPGFEGIVLISFLLIFVCYLRREQF